MREDRCGLPYERYGDIRECLLPYNHDRACPEANLFRDGLERRTWLAQNDGWL